MKTFRRVVLCIACVFTVICIVFCIKINKQYPKTEVLAYGINEEISIEDYSFTVDKFEIVDYMEFKELHNIEYAGLDEYVEKENIKVVAVTVTVRNNGDNDVIPQIYQLTLCSESYSNGVDLDVFKGMYNNSTSLLSPLLPPGKGIQIILPYVVYGTSLDSVSEEQFKGRDFDLMFSLYPRKIYVDLTE